MTLIAGFKRGRNVIIAQDGAFVNGADGVLYAGGPKSITIGNLPAVIGFSGEVPYRQGVAYFADRANRVLSPVAKLQDLLLAIPEIAGDAIACRLTIGAWDRLKREARLFTFANRDSLAVPGVRAGELVEAEMLLGVSFEPSDLLGTDFGTRPTDDQIIALYEAQRQHKAAPVDQGGVACHSVGVMLNCVTVSRRGASERTIWHWADKLGEPITPTTGRAFDIRQGDRLEVAYA
jgi:hypothetical protein